MYYKVIYNKQVIDVLDKLDFCKYQLKHKILLLCPEEGAQGILSSDGSTAYHLSTCLPFPTDIFPTVTIEEITKSEYDQLVKYHLKSAQEITAELITELIERGII